MKMQEKVTGQEVVVPQIHKPKTSFEFTNVVEAIKSGEKKNEDLELFDKIESLLSPEQRQPMIDYMVQQERCTNKFAEHFFSEKKFRKRVMSLNENFLKHGEKMLRLEEAEIWIDLMEAGSDDIGPLLDTTDPTKQFKQLKPLDKKTMQQNRLFDLKNRIPDILGVEEEQFVHSVFKQNFHEVGLPYSKKNEDWLALFNDPERMDAFLSLDSINELYEQLTKGQQLDALARRVQLFWKTNETGQRIPAMHVQNMAENPDTKYVSEIGFVIEKEPAKENDPKGGRRLLKDLLVIVDKEARGSSDGANFLLGNLKLIKKYQLEEAEFVANIKIGSYVWARISDVDIPTMAEKLPGKTKTELGPKPWNEKEIRGMVFRDMILPTFEKNLVKAIHSVISSIHNPEKKKEMQTNLVENLMNNQYSKLKERALAGDLTMEELVDLGKGLNVCKFDEEGDIVQADSPNATHQGHLGKAAIMGVTWTARLKLDTRSLFGVVDKLTKGSGFIPFIKRVNQKLGLALSL
ncbi:MAG: hypothetical protein NUV54_02435 [Candidatus Taylorbacteria bacterium]|nr:hypothetical protein [bacterium]MCR4311400.1 hypothetical protein [Candidatus Taylorbacteria bacterium]